MHAGQASASNDLHAVNEISHDLIAIALLFSPQSQLASISRAVAPDIRKP